MIETEVAIVGCGPVGALMANLLAARGIRTVVLEKDRTIYDLPRAIAMDDEVMRIFQSQGLEAAYTENATAIRGMDLLRGNRRRLRRISLESAPQTFGLPVGTFFHQPTLEKHLRRGFERYPEVLDVRLGVQVTEIRDGDPIELDIVDTETGETETVRATYLLGCDGGRSFVRKTFGIEQDDLGLHQPWVVVDVKMKKPGERSGYAEQICDPAQPATYIPAPSPRNRWEFMLQPGDDHQAATSTAFLSKRIMPWAAPEEYDIERAVVYTFHAVIAKSWRTGKNGNVLLLGDAAHQMPPFLGQGMCAGIRDAFNLAWKLELVLRNHAEPALLDTFYLERQEHVRKVIVLAIRVGTIIQSRSYVKSFLVNTAMLAMERLGIGMPLAAVKDLPLGPGFFSCSHGPDKTKRCPFPQPSVVTPDGAACRLDACLGNTFTLLSRAREPHFPHRDPLIRHLGIYPAGQSHTNGAANAIVDSERVLETWLDCINATPCCCVPIGSRLDSIKVTTNTLTLSERILRGHFRHSITEIRLTCVRRHDLVGIHIARHEHDGRVQWAAVIDKQLRPIAGTYPSLASLLANGRAAIDAAVHSDQGLPVKSAKLLCPVTGPCSIVCQGLNYSSHRQEAGRTAHKPPFNLMFTKAWSSLSGPHDDVVRPKGVKLLDYELELGLVIGTAIEGPVTVTNQNLHTVAAGVVITNDISARDVQIPQQQWFKGKSFRTFCPAGPYLYLLNGPDDVAKVLNMDIELAVNGESRQKASTSQLLYGPAETLTELSRVMNLYPGDLILTGTPGGVAIKAPSHRAQRIARILMDEAKMMKNFLKRQSANPNYLNDGDVIRCSMRSPDGSIDLGEMSTKIVSKT